MKPRAMAILLDDGTVRVAVEFYAGAAFFHCAFRRWSVKAMRTLDAAIPKMRGLMLRCGFRCVHLFIHEGKPILYRFCERLGFQEVKRANGFILMQQEVDHA